MLDIVILRFPQKIQLHKHIKIHLLRFFCCNMPNYVRLFLAPKIGHRCMGMSNLHVPQREHQSQGAFRRPGAFLPHSHHCLFARRCICGWQRHTDDVMSRKKRVAATYLTTCLPSSLYPSAFSPSPWKLSHCLPFSLVVVS